MTSIETTSGSWRDAFLSYKHPRVLAMLFLGFSAGLPFPLVFTTLTAWLASAEVARASIGLFAWVGILYSVKFFWAPIIDRLPIPVLTPLLGRRRSWMLLAQSGIALALLGLAGADPVANLALVAVLAVAVAFCSATQDVVVDAYRIEAAEDERQGAMAASYQLGYRIGVLVAVAGALYVADFGSWRLAYTLMAVLMGVGMITALVIGEPRVAARPVFEVDRSLNAVRRAAAWFTDALGGPFVEFFKRNGPFAIVLLAFVTVHRISDILLGIMANPFYIDIGYTLSEIASVAKIFGFFVTITGAAVGGVVVARYGPARPLLLATSLLAATNLCFAALAYHGTADLWFLAVTISADNFAMGFSTTVYIAYLSSLTNQAYTATQFALFSSLATLPGKVLSGFSGFLVDATDWISFFVYASAMGVPAIVLAIVIIGREPRPAVPVPS